MRGSIPRFIFCMGMYGWYWYDQGGFRATLIEEPEMHHNFVFVKREGWTENNIHPLEVPWLWSFVTCFFFSKRRVFLDVFLLALPLPGQDFLKKTKRVSWTWIVSLRGSRSLGLNRLNSLENIGFEHPTVSVGVWNYSSGNLPGSNGGLRSRWRDLWVESIKNWMGPNPNGPRSVSCDRAIRYSGFFGVRETWVLLEISWIETNHIFFGPSPFILRHLLGFQWCPTMNTLRQNHRELVHMRYYFDKGRAPFGAKVLTNKKNMEVENKNEIFKIWQFSLDRFPDVRFVCF